MVARKAISFNSAVVPVSQSPVPVTPRSFLPCTNARESSERSALITMSRDDNAHGIVGSGSE
jgi:hypothetical protein